MSLFRRIVPAPRVQTLGEMVAYSLTNEATRGLWERKGRDMVSKALSVTVPEYLWRDSAITVHGKPVPIPYANECEITRAVNNWRKWDNECRRAEAMVSFVDAFEQATSPRLMRDSAETGNTDSARRARAGNSAE